MDHTRQEIESLARRLYGAHPERGVTPNRSLRVHDLTRMTDGWETDVYALSVVAENPAGRQVSDELILRVYQGQGATSKAQREFATMAHLYEVGYPVPQVLLLEATDGLLGKPVMIMERIAGQSLGSILACSDQATRLTLLQKFSAMLHRLHQLDWGCFPSVILPDGTQDTGEIFWDMLDHWEAQLAGVGTKGFNSTISWLRDHLSELEFGVPSPVHLDYHPHNVLVRDDGRWFVIDWTNAAISDYRLDLAWTLVLIGSYSSWEIARYLLQAYERCADHVVDAVDDFIVAACLRRLGTIIVSLEMGAKHLGMRQGAEVMMKDIRHIRRVYALLQERADVSIADVEDLLTTST